MWYHWLFFFFVAFGAKVVLAFVMIYLLLPTDRRCNQCDEDTLLMRTNRIGRVGFALTFGRVQWRWCPRCGWEGLARGSGRRTRRVRRPVESPAPTPR